MPLPLKMFNKKKSALVMNGKVVTHVSKMPFQKSVVQREQKTAQHTAKKPQKIIDDDTDNENTNTNSNNNNIHTVSKEDTKKESAPVQQHQPQLKSSPSPLLTQSQPPSQPLPSPLALPQPPVPLLLPSAPQDQAPIPTKPKYIEDKEKLQLSVLISKLSEEGLLNFLIKVDDLSQNLIEVYNNEQIYFKVERISKDIYQTIFANLNEILQEERDSQSIITLGTFK